MAKPYDFSTALMVPQQGPKAKARADQAAIEKRRRELIDEKQTMDARKEDQVLANVRRQSYADIGNMQFAPQNPIRYKNTVPAVELSQAPLQPGTETAVGGPEGKPAPWANDPVVEDDAPPAASAKPWDSDPVVEDDTPTNDIDAAINEAANAVPGGYDKWLADNGYPARDPLAKPGTPTRERDLFDKAQAGEVQNAPELAWNEQLADMLGKGVDFLMEPINSRDAGPNDPIKPLTQGFVEPMARFPEALARDPLKTVAQDYNPIFQTGMGYKDVESAAGKALQGKFDEAGPQALQGITQMGMGALGLVGLKGGPKAPAPLKATSVAQAERMAANTTVPPSVVAKPGSMREPSVRDTGKTLAAVAVPGRQLRPQALQAFTRILTNSNVPTDRIASGLARIVEGLKGPVDSQTGRAPSIALLLKREFGPEFPEVVTNIDLVRLERRLSKKAGDASPTIVREAVKDLRGSQASYLTDSATRNAGATTRNATRKDMEATLTEFGEEGYKPLISQPIDAARAETIQGVLTGPGMAELGKPLRQIAAGEGKTIEGMIEESPLRAAHWMQHKARLLAEENGGTSLGGAYNNMRNRILATIDDLKTPDGKTYKDLRNEYAETAQIGQSLKAGDQFGAAVKNPEKATAFIEKFEAATPAQQDAQLASIGDWVLSKVRGGGEGAPARMTELQNTAVLDTLDKLGPKGKALAEDIRAIRDEEIDLQAFYPKAESQTASNQVALAEGPDVYSRNAKGSLGMTAAADGTLMAAGATQAPLLSALRQGPRIYRGLMQPKTATREDMTRLLMARPGARPKGETVAPPPTPPTRTIPPKRDPALTNLSPGDMVAYIEAKYPRAGSSISSPSPYWDAATAIKRANGDRAAAAAELQTYADYLKKTKAKPELIDAAERTVRAVADVDPIFFDDAAFTASMKGKAEAGGNSAMEQIRGATADDGIGGAMDVANRADDMLPGERPIAPRGKPAPKPPTRKN